MLFDEHDIDLLKLNDRQFEEACFDLLLSLDYQSLIWRQGGADSGRDIEGKRTVSNTLVGPYVEKWFFECKRHSKGISPEVLNFKIAWADVEKPNHFVVLTSSYITDGARLWLEKMAPHKSYSIHIVDGKALKRLFSQKHDIAARYFANKEAQLLIDARKTWLMHSIVPDPEIISLLAKKIDNKRMLPDELAFLWCAAKYKASEMEAWIEEHEPVYMDPIFECLAPQINALEILGHSNKDFIVETFSVGDTKWERAYKNYIAASLVLNASTKPRRALYAYVSSNENEGLEVVVEASSNFATRIYHTKSNARIVHKNIIDIFVERLINLAIKQYTYFPLNRHKQHANSQNSRQIVWLTPPRLS